MTLLMDLELKGRAPHTLTENLKTAGEQDGPFSSFILMLSWTEPVVLD